jgi:hypothetical protein
MEPSPQHIIDESPNNEQNDRIPKQVWLATWLTVFGTVMLGTVAFVASEGEPVAGPCIGIAVMMAIVCYAMIRYR